MFIATDIGGTTGRVLAYSSLDSTTPLGTDTFKICQVPESDSHASESDLNNLIRSIHRLSERFGPVEGIGCAVAGKVSNDRAKLVLAGALSNWVGIDLRVILEDEFGSRVVIGNDAEALALAEAIYGLGTAAEYRSQDFLGMIWGTGIGGACVRYPASGYLTTPMEPGHLSLSLDLEAPLCACGKRGHLEAYAGGNNFIERTGKPAKALTRDDWREALAWMIAGIKSILLLQPVPLIIFSGGVACKQSWMLPELEHALAEEQYGIPLVRQSVFGESAGSLGALSLLSL